MSADYIELHAASAFSFLRGCSPPEQLMREAARLDLPALAVLGLLARIKGRHRTVIAHHAGPDFAALTQFLRELFDGHGVAPCVDKEV